MKKILSFFLVLLFVASCGGGSGDGGSSVETPQETPCPENVDAFSYPDQSSWQYVEELCDNGSVVSYSCQRENGGIVAFGDNLNGVCEYLYEQEINPQPMEPEEIMEPESPVESAEYECPDRTDFLDFLQQGLVQTIARFNSQPELSFADGITSYQKDVTRKAVELLNEALPDDYRIAINSVEVESKIQIPPSENIYIDFAPSTEWVPAVFDDKVLGFTTDYLSTVGSAHVWIDSQKISSISENRLIWLLSHELLHAMGFTGHISPSNYLPVSFGEEDGAGVDFYTLYPYYSILWDIIPSEESERLVIRDRTSEILTFQMPVIPPSEFIKGTLYPVDWWGLKYLYEELETGDEPVFDSEAINEWLTEKGC